MMCGKSLAHSGSTCKSSTAPGLRTPNPHRPWEKSPRWPLLALIAHWHHEAGHNVGPPPDIALKPPDRKHDDVMCSNARICGLHGLNGFGVPDDLSRCHSVTWWRFRSEEDLDMRGPTKLKHVVPRASHAPCPQDLIDNLTGRRKSDVTKQMHNDMEERTCTGPCPRPIRTKR